MKFIYLNCGWRSSQLCTQQVHNCDDLHLFKKCYYMYLQQTVERCSGILGEVKIFLNNIKLYSIKFENETFIGNF